MLLMSSFNMGIYLYLSYPKFAPDGQYAYTVKEVLLK